MYDVAVKLPTLTAVLVCAAAYAAPNAKTPSTPWKKPPGPIAGRWKATCPNADGMIITVTVSDDKASGKVEEAGNGGKYGYKSGEEILRLAVDDFGEWVGQLEWRGVSGASRWDPIRFTASPDELDAVMTTSDCFRKMPRVR